MASIKDFPFLKYEQNKLREQVTFTGAKLEIFLPDYYLEKAGSIAEIVGDLVETVGIFWFKVDEKDLYHLNMPIKFMFEFSEREKVSLKLKPEMPRVTYEKFTLKNGDAFVYDTNHEKTVDNMNWFFTRHFTGGKVAPDIPYEKAYNVFINALLATGSNAALGVSSVNIEMLISELYRSKSNTTYPFRFTYNKLKPYDYKMVRITKVPQLNSVFTSLMGEDIKLQLVSSILRTREGRENRVSPIEKTIKF